MTASETLREVAREYGVEFYEPYHNPNGPRSDIEIAMDVLTRLPTQQGIRHLSFDFVGPPHRQWTFEGKAFGTFVDAVIALAERARAGK